MLTRRHLECYLFDDKLIKRLCQINNKTDMYPECMRMKEEALEKSKNRGNPSDDIKSASGDIYNGLKRILNLTQCGNNAHSFLRDTMAPLLTPDMDLYTELKQCIFGE